MSWLYLLLITTMMKTSLVVSSPAFAEGDLIPLKYTCEGENISPELNLKELPQETKSLAIIVDDPDAPKGTFVHWVSWNLLPSDKIAENSKQGIEGINDRKQNGYTGPCPPSGTHRYYFKVYALSTMLNLEEGADKEKLEEAMKGLVVAEGQLMGKYEKQKK